MDERVDRSMVMNQKIENSIDLNFSYLFSSTSFADDPLCASFENSLA